MAKFTRQEQTITRLTRAKVKNPGGPSMRSWYSLVLPHFFRMGRQDCHDPSEVYCRWVRSGRNGNTIRTMTQGSQGSQGLGRENTVEI